jgi:retron-type reverse transcriptase
VLRYIERWLKVPVQMEDGSVVPRTAGTPQGGVVSPILANLFLHYAFDTWMARTYPHIPFERYADDAICHCKSAEEAQALWSALADRFAACKLVLHPEKTKSSTARMQTGVAIFRTKCSTFSASISACGKDTSTRTASCPQPARRR